MNAPTLPWTECKIAFDIEDDDSVWSAASAGELPLPVGWSLAETDGAGARFVAIFTVSVLPTASDGAEVQAAISRINEEFCRELQGQDHDEQD